ncbi:response regulator [Campylobacter sp. Marseille-Q3452]|uniref:Response regulator n=1 Tax=Campylobacter massiliensis TaxID=2762557 RepID=A0A842JAN6_9BACT|nr:response regulator [Campylobacter massiliensis]MBC2883039.1 response regulator [Campylobacter massiliensis]
MTIEEQKFIQKILAELAQKSSKAAKEGDFEKELKRAAEPVKTSKEPDVEGFKRTLTELGAAGFLSQMNEQKIQEKLRAKKEELMEALGLNTDMKKSLRDELEAVLDELLTKYEKELRASLQSNSLLEKQQALQNKNPSMLGTILGIV